MRREDLDFESIPYRSYLRECPWLLEAVSAMHRDDDPDMEKILHLRPALRCFVRLLDNDRNAPNDLMFLTRYGDPDASFILAMHFLEESPEKAAVFLLQPAKQGYADA